MKLKYYLRGLGLGIIVTALVLTIAGGNKESLSDEEIKSRAARLGMVESSSLTLADIQNTASGAEKESSESGDAVEETSAPAEENAAQSSENAMKDTEAEQESSAAEDTSEAGQEENQETDALKESQGADKETMVETSEPSEDTKSDKDSENQQTNTDVSEASGSETENTVSNQGVTDGVVRVTVQAGESSYTVSKKLEELGLIEDALSFDKYLCDIGYSRVIHTGTHRIVIGTSEEEIAKIITGKR